MAHLSDQIVDAVGDGSAFDLEIVIREDGPTRAGTAGAVRRALDALDDTFLVTYGDTYLPTDHRAAYAAFTASGLPALMCVLRNEGRWDTSNAALEGDLVRYDKRDPTPDMEWIDYGLLVFAKEAFSLVPADLSDLADVLTWLSRERLLAGHAVSERFHEIGTPASLAETDAVLRALLD